MPNTLLPQLDQTPAQVRQLSSKLRNRVLNFLLRWEAWAETLACLPDQEMQRLISLQDIQARALLGLGQVDNAITVLEARLRSRDAVAARNQLVRLYLAKGDHDHALSLAKELTETSAEYGPNWSVLGDVYLERNEIAAAESAFLHHHQLARGSRQPLVGLMRVHHRRGDGVSALAYAVRAYTVNDGEFPLSIFMLRELHAYFTEIHDANRTRTAEAQLAQRLVDEIAELREQLTEEVGNRPAEGQRATTASGHRPVSEPPQRVAQPLPDLRTISVSAGERAALFTALQTHFGFPDFLPAQVEIMACSRRGEHLLAVLPTGGGKSLCYQLLAFMEEGITLVVSPLIALMKDQVDNLPSVLRQRAIAINGEMDGQTLHHALHDLAKGRYQLAYVTPERLRQLPFLHTLRQLRLARLVIDEAHCVSVWGHDFRPDYLRLAEAHRTLGSPPILAMTATAPPLVRQDIERQLLGKESAGTAPLAGAGMRLIATDIFRANLQLQVIKVRDEDEKRQRLLALCHTLSGSGIVYARTRQRCEEFAAMLQRHGIQAAAYHAGLPNRAAIQEEFMAGNMQVIVATIAFGMGIDKADIRFVIHYGLPDSVEAYYQEIGRAGRDGQSAQCIMLYSSSDKALLTRHANESVLQIDFLRELYRALQYRLPERQTGTLPLDTIQRALRCPDETPVRIALSLLEQVGALTRYHDAPRSLTLERRREDGDPAFVAFAEQVRLPLHQHVTRTFTEIAVIGALALTALEEQLHAWQQAGYLRYQTHGRDLLLSLPPAPEQIAQQLTSLLDQYATIQRQHVTDIVDYARSGYCRHGYLANHLGGTARRQCTNCDNCGVETVHFDLAQLPADAEQAQTILRALAEQGWGKRNLIGLLRGDRTLPGRAQASNAFGTLSFRSENALAKLIDQLIAEDAISETTLPHGGIALGLTERGRAICRTSSQIYAGARA